MSRNAESRFAVNPTHLDISRSRFDRSHSIKTTFNVGDIVPFFCDEVLPGDTFSVDTSKVVRMQTLLTPMMDNIYLDTYFFFVPNRLVWEHWKQFMGENTQSAWLPTVEYQIPQLTAPAAGWNIGTLADYFGIPTGVANLSVNALPFRAYALICNEWFRDENLTDPLSISTGDATQVGVNTGSYVTDVALGGLPFKAAKYHDYFTSALPAPQKGPDVTIPVATQGNIPVFATDQVHDVTELPSYPNGSTIPMYMASKPMSWAGSPPAYQYYFQDFMNTGSGNEFGWHRLDDVSIAQDYNTSLRFAPSNLWAMNDGIAAAATINQLRMAFQIQKLYERDARGGTRYIEILKSHFGVTSPDSRLQRPEYLGGNRIPININQVIQQSATDGLTGSPQGTVAAMSLTTDTHSDFTHSFTEHGFVLGLMVARYDHTYQQGIRRMWSRKDRFDFYFPVFANIGEQAILNKEIYAQGNAKDDEVFGYQEAWADYRYSPNFVTGEMRSSAPQSLDVWHLADDYESLPTLSDSWIRETSETVNRVLAVSDNVAAQLFADIYIKNRTTRPMPLYSVPGLIDHH